MSTLATITYELEPNAVLELAKGRLNDVLIIGWDKAGDLFVTASPMSLADFNYLLTCATAIAHRAILEGEDEPD